MMANSSHDHEVFTYFNEIGIISQLSTGLFEQCLPEGLTQSQFSVLNWFVRVDLEATPGRLARAFQVTGGAMTNTLKKLEAKGLVKVEPDRNSGRKKRVTMTRKGSRVRDKAIKAVAPLLREFAEHFPVEKLRRQTRQLAEVRQYMDEYRYK
jgi:DNA-binding MarR family transcriptional regulator